MTHSQSRCNKDTKTALWIVEGCGCIHFPSVFKLDPELVVTDNASKGSHAAMYITSSSAQKPCFVDVLSRVGGNIVHCTTGPGYFAQAGAGVPGSAKTVPAPLSSSTPCT